MPMLPSASSTVPHRPSPGRRSPTEREHRGSARRGLGHGDRRDVDPEGCAPGGARTSTNRPGPQPTSSTGASHRLGQHLVGSRPSAATAGRPAACAPPPTAPAPAVGLRTWTRDPDRAASNSTVGGQGPATSRRCSRANRVSGARAATAAASSGVSTSRSRGSAPTRRPSRRSRASCAAPVVRGRHRHARETPPGGAGAARPPRTRRPRSRPRTASTPDQRRPRCAAVSWGVSMPTRRVGSSVPSPRTSAKTVGRAARRGRRPRCGTTVAAGRQPRPAGGPSQATTARDGARRRPRRGCRGSRRAARAAASRRREGRRAGASSPVPATGALASTTTACGRRGDVTSASVSTRGTATPGWLIGPAPGSCRGRPGGTERRAGDLGPARAGPVRHVRPR